MYMSLEVATDAVWRRWNDAALRQKVLAFTGGVPDVLLSEPRAVLARFIVTPNFEFCRFTEITQGMGIRPLAGEYTRDKFCSINPDKRLLGKMTFLRGGNDQGQQTASYNIVDFSKDDGRVFSSLKTLWAQEFPDFHHWLLSVQLPGLDLFDFSEWFQLQGGHPAEFYPRFLSLFVCHGILFENFLTEGYEAGFTREIIWPALAKIEAYFGLKPLIVPVVPLETEREPYWSWYPEALEKEVRCLLPKGRDKGRPGTRTPVAAPGCGCRAV